MPKPTFELYLDSIATGDTPLFCAQHFYTPSRVSKPANGCADCWRVFYWTIYAKTPVEDRAAFVEGMTEVVSKMVEHEKLGTWDFDLQAHPTITIEKEPD